MKDAIDVTVDVRSLINIPAVTSLLTGTIHMTERPSGRQNLADIVINCPSISNTQKQVGFPNVNVYWPNLSTGLADQANLRRVGKIVAGYLDTRWEKDFQLEVENAGAIVKDTDGSNFYTISLKYQALQNNYQNI